MTARSFGRQEFRHPNPFDTLLAFGDFRRPGRPDQHTHQAREKLFIPFSFDEVYSHCFESSPASFLDKSCWVPSNGLNTSLNGINSGSEFRTFERMGIGEDMGVL
ncbi:hypothetical protein RclHR1_17890001 [Rhizophagus clarus]|uniref:Uncharacterized protein n=1 Tax=Rhizophagus clarus TaxID=94130 RepID=A0A2Z6QL43_9GLOM|nr:hypothetical protein RclHR1_17890001 [Rhizophagus clarus]